MTSIVLDASAGVEALLETNVGQRIEAIADGLTLWVPEHFFAEVGAALRRFLLLGQITGERAAAALDKCLATPARRVQVRPLLSEAWTLRDNVTVADAIYVVMARHLRAPLITLDEKLAAAPTIDIQVITP